MPLWIPYLGFGDVGAFEPLIVLSVFIDVVDIVINVNINSDGIV